MSIALSVNPKLQFASQYAQTLNSHVILITAEGQIDQLEADFGNVLDYEGQIIAAIADHGHTCLPRKTLEDAETLISDISIASRRRNASTAVSMQLISPTGHILSTHSVKPTSPIIALPLAA